MASPLRSLTNCLIQFQSTTGGVKEDPFGNMSPVFELINVRAFLQVEEVGADKTLFQREQREATDGIPMRGYCVAPKLLPSTITAETEAALTFGDRVGRFIVTAINNPFGRAGIGRKVERIVGTSIYGWFQPGVELLGFNPPININKIMQLQCILGSKFSAHVTVTDCSGLGIDLTDIPIDVSVTDSAGTLWAKLGVTLFDQTLNPGKIELWAEPIGPDDWIVPGTYKRNMPEQCTYAILLNFDTGPRFAYPPSDFIAIQSPQNTLILSGADMPRASVEIQIIKGERYDLQLNVIGNYATWIPTGQIRRTAADADILTSWDFAATTYDSVTGKTTFNGYLGASKTRALPIPSSAATENIPGVSCWETDIEITHPTDTDNVVKILPKSPVRVTAEVTQ